MNSSRIVGIMIGTALASALAFSILVLLSSLSARAGQVAMAVEFNGHSAAAQIALDKGWFEEEGAQRDEARDQRQREASNTIRERLETRARL